MTDEKPGVAVVGGGLIGSLLAVLLRKRGHNVDLFERWPDMRKQENQGGRSINLVLTSRGIVGLKLLGLDDGALKLCVPVKGRMMHSPKGELTFTPYGNENEWNNSISRADLNKFLLDAAENCGVKIHFQHALDSVDFASSNPTNAEIKGVSLTFAKHDGTKVTHFAPFAFGADGGGSAMRREMLKANPDMKATEDILDFVYKEITFPALEGGEYPMQADALHIWARGAHMLMGLADLAGSFTGTLYLPRTGPNSVEQLNTREAVLDFFKQNYADAIPLIGGEDRLVDLFTNNPNGLLGTVRTAPWQLNSRALLIGDAAHAIVPFFGQGCNCGFEDCLVFDQCLTKHGGNLELAIQDFAQTRPKDSNAIADLALENFVEMRERVADPKFLQQKRLERELETKLAKGTFRSKYAMVVYSHIPYSVCQRLGKVQENLLQELLAEGGVEAVDLVKAQKLVDERVASVVKEEGITLDF